MEEWKEYKLGEIADIQTGPFGSQLHQRDYVDVGTPCIMPTNIGTHLDINSDGIAHVKDEDVLRLKRHCVEEGDIIYSRRGDIEKCAFISKDREGWLCGTGCLRIRIDGLKANPLFIAYQLSTKESKKWIVGNAVGTTMLNLNTGILKDLPLFIPNRQKQNNIVAILKSLDDKIELNRRINENLEQQAQALFKSWFVDFEPFRDGEFVESELGMIPKGWRVGDLNEIAEIIMGSSPSGTSYNTEGNGDVFYQGRAEFGFRFPHRNLYTTEAKRFADVDTVLVSVRAPVGDINVAEERCCIGRGLASVKSKFHHNSFVLYLLQNLRPIFDRFNGEGTVFGCINKKAFEELKIVIPDKEVITRFDSIAKNMDCKIKRCEQESRRLAELRDALLPKLMSGELKVNDVSL